jgi:hypothetical protein
MNPQASSSSHSSSHPEARSSQGTDQLPSTEHEHTTDASGRRRRKRRPRTWARRMKQKLMPVFWVVIGLAGLYFVVHTVLSMTALK